MMDIALYKRRLIHEFFSSLSRYRLTGAENCTDHEHEKKHDFIFPPSPSERITILSTHSRKKREISLPPRHLCNSSSYLLIAPRSLETFSFSFSYRRFHSSAVSSSFTTTTFLMVLALKNCDNDQVERRNQRELLGVGRCSKTARGPLYDISSRTIT